MNLASRMVLASVLMVSSTPAFTQTAEPPTSKSAKTPAEVTFQFDRTGLPVPRFTLRLREDGTGNYQADQVEIAATATSMRGQAAQHIDRSISISPETAAKIFKEARALNYFNVECASKAKNIADTGKKTVSYSGSDGSGSCAYNYSENKKSAL